MNFAAAPKSISRDCSISLFFAKIGHHVAILRQWQTHFYDYYGMSFHIPGFRLRLKRQANAAAILASGKNKLPLTNIFLVELALFKKQVQGKPFLIPDYLPILALDRFEHPVRERRGLPNGIAAMAWRGHVGCCGRPAGLQRKLRNPLTSEQSTTHNSLILSSKKSSMLIYCTPLSSVHGRILSPTTTILANESSIRLREFTSCCRFSSSAVVRADWM